MRICDAFSRFAFAATFCAPLLAAGWADRGEYDMALAIRSEASAQKRIELLDRWQAKYPQSAFRQQRRELYLANYASMGDGARMLKTAREMLDEQANNPVGIYWCTLLIPEVRNAPPDVLDIGEKSARQLLAGLDTYFAATAKPAGASETDWNKRRTSAELLAHRTLGWVAWQRGDLDEASKEFRSYLDQSPTAGEITAWLGIVSAMQKEPEKRVTALWYLQRAAALRGERALASDQARMLSGLADDVYTAYHGDKDGLEELKSAVAASALPPPDFHIETAAAVAARKADEELTRTNPELAAWIHLRRQLESADGAKVLADLQGKPLPKLKGTVIRVQPENSPSEVVLGMSQPLTEEVVLRINQPFPNAAPAGAELEFEGAVESFAKEPFTLTIAVDRDKIAGWPEAPPPPSRKGK
jgi:hypothetical protein